MKTKYIYFNFILIIFYFIVQLVLKSFFNVLQSVDSVIYIKILYSNNFLFCCIFYFRNVSSNRGRYVHTVKYFFTTVTHTFFIHLDINNTKPQMPIRLRDYPAALPRNQIDYLV